LAGNEDEVHNNIERCGDEKGHFTWIVGIIIIFYFGSRLLEEYLKRKEEKEGEEESTPAAK